MNPILRNFLAAVSGLVLGSVVNMGIISISGSIIPPPEGADMTTMEGLQSAMQLMEPKHFLFPFLAHALGTLFGAFLAAKASASHHLKVTLVVGLFFFAGGLITTFSLPSPVWFSILDLAGAYFPMAYLGWKFSGKKKDL